MTEINTPKYSLGTIELTIGLELKDMPVTPTHFAANPIIADTADIQFEVTGGIPVFKSIGLIGSIPLKSGGPSKRPQTDSYWRINADMPEPIQDVVAYATARVTEMLK